MNPPPIVVEPVSKRAIDIASLVAAAALVIEIVPQQAIEIEYLTATTNPIVLQAAPRGRGIPGGGTTGQYLAKASVADYDTAWSTLDKAAVGLGNVDDTSDADKPVSSAQQAAIDAEAQARATADTALQANINSEASARSSADIAEANARADADATEASARAAADALLIPLSQKGAANGVATLGADSKIPGSQLPALAITSPTVVASQAAQLALAAEEGDVAIRSDLNQSYIRNNGTSGTMADWTLLLTPTDAVLSVAGKTGAVALVKGDVGLGNVDNTSDASKPVSTAQQAALDTKVAKAGDTMTGALTVDNVITISRGPFSITGNLGIGSGALASITAGSGGNNVAIGLNAGTAVTSGNQNVFVGVQAGGAHTTGGANVAVGYQAGSSFAAATGSALVGMQAGQFQSGPHNVALGYQAGRGVSGSTNGTGNITIGSQSGLNITTGNQNILIGYQCGTSLTTGANCIILGQLAGAAYTTNSNAIAIGVSAAQNMTGVDNVAIGVTSQLGVSGSSSGAGNTSIGSSSLKAVTTGNQNVAIGYFAIPALTTGSGNVSIGGSSNGQNLTTGGNNTFIGAGTGRGITTGSNNTVIGAAVTGLSATLANNIILADGAGNIRVQADTAKVKFNLPVGLPSYTVATVPSASVAGAGAIIYVSNESGGANTAFSDGTNWRRHGDRAIIS
jgi:hypothetical protein